MWKEGRQVYGTDSPDNTFVAEASIQLKLVSSSTGPGQMMGYALWHTGNTENQVSGCGNSEGRIIRCVIDEAMDGQV